MKSFINIIKQNKIYQIVIFITILGFIFRIYHLGYLTLWVDEYVHALHCKNFVQDLGGFLPGEKRGFILNFLIILFYYLFEINEFCSRFPVAIISTLSIPFYYLLFRKISKNEQISVLTIILFVASQYLLFLSKICRIYGTGLLFHAISILLIFKGFYAENNDKIKNIYFKKLKIQPKFIWLFLLFFTIAFLENPFNITIFFSFTFFGFLMFIYEFFKTKKIEIKNLFLAILFILSLMFLFVPFLRNKILYNFLSISVSTNMANWLLPDLTYLKEMIFVKKDYKIFNIYFDVIKTDFGNLWYLALVGLGISFFRNFKVFAFIFSFFILNFILLSFYFATFANGRNISFAYPIFLFAIVYGVYTPINMFFDFFKNKNEKNKKKVTDFNFFNKPLIICIIIFIFYIPFKELKELVNISHHGNIVNPKLETWYFTNWKEPIKKANKDFKKGDVILSTVVPPFDFYLKTTQDYKLSVFRQRDYNTNIRSYDSRANMNIKCPACSPEELVNTIKTNQRGWIFADYYFYNVMTDENAREIVITNLDFNFDYTNDDVKVFSWDLTKGLDKPKKFLEVLGKGERNLISNPIEFDVSQSILNKQKVVLFIDCEGIDANSEAILSVNNKYNLYIPTNNQKGRTVINLEIGSQNLVLGKNTFTFYYNDKISKNEDVQKGFAVYNLTFAVDK